jgi:hypothetical protein
MAISVPYIDIDADSRRSATQTHFDAANILARFELKVPDFGAVNAANEVVVLLLLLSNSLGRSRRWRRFTGLTNVKKWHSGVS